MDRIAIIGLGLMGGSLGLAIRAHGIPLHIVGSTRSRERGQLALQRKAIDELFSTPEAAVRDADIVVYCAPILSIPGLIKQSLGSLKKGCLLTDVGSTKALLTGEIRTIVKDRSDVAFVGSHPIAGSEQHGIEFARSDLYDGATVVVTADKSSKKSDVNALIDFWRGVGGVVYEMEAEKHDQMVARTSHLPHMIASLLVTTVGRTGQAESVGAFCGTGFRDTTRVAEGSPEIWKDIVETNHERVAGELRVYKEQLDRLIKLLDEKDFDGVSRILEEAGHLRKTILAGSPATGKNRGVA